MALGHSSLGEVGWGGDVPPAKKALPKLPPSNKRKTLTVKQEGDKVRLTYSMSIQKPKGAPDVSTEVTLGQMRIQITPTTTPGWSMLTVETVVDKQ
jgi:hypothetical protein